MIWSLVDGCTAKTTLTPNLFTTCTKKKQEEFADVPFDQFKKQFRSGIDKAAVRRRTAAKQLEAMEHDRQLYPRQTHNHRGEPVFDLDVEAKEQLQEDIECMRHKWMEPSELQNYREVYQKYKPHIFRFRIYQEVRRQKFLNYLDLKRKAKQEEFAKKKAKAAKKRAEKK